MKNSPEDTITGKPRRQRRPARSRSKPETSHRTIAARPSTSKTPTVERALEHFRAGWRERYGTDYAAGPADAQAFAKLVEWSGGDNARAEELLRKIVDAFLRSERRQLVETRHPPILLATADIFPTLRAMAEGVALDNLNGLFFEKQQLNPPKPTLGEMAPELEQWCMERASQADDPEILRRLAEAEAVAMASKRARLRAESNVPKRFADADLDHPGRKFPVPPVPPRFRLAAELLKGMAQVPPSRLLVALLGAPRLGKSWLAAAACNAFADSGRLANFWRIGELGRKVRSTFRQYARDDETEYKLMKRLTDLPLLAIDDLQTRLGTASDDQMLADLIYDRYHQCVPTIITSNLVQEEFDKEVGQGVVTIFKEVGAVVMCEWPALVPP